MNDPVSVLIIDIRPGEKLVLSGVVSVQLLQKSGRLARLRVTAPREISIEKKDSPVASMAT